MGTMDINGHIPNIQNFCFCQPSGAWQWPIIYQDTVLAFGMVRTKHHIKKFQYPHTFKIIRVNLVGRLLAMASLYPLLFKNFKTPKPRAKTAPRPLTSKLWHDAAGK